MKYKLTVFCRTGAANILTNLDDVDLTAMFCGRVSYDQTPRIRRIAHLDCLRLPGFMKDFDRYKHLLRYIAYVNGLGDKPAMLAPPERRLQRVDSAKFDYEAYKLKRDGKARRRDDVIEQSPFMCFVYKDSPVERRPMTSHSMRSKRSTHTPDVIIANRMTQSGSKDFLYPVTPVPEAHYVSLRDLLYPELNLDLDTSRSMDRAAPPAGVSKSERAVSNKQPTTLPGILSVTDRRWHKR